MHGTAAQAGVTVARALGSPTRAEIYAHLREAAEERTVRDIAARFELHPNVARTHLELLADAGLVRVGRRKHPGGGRPAKVYSIIQDATPAAAAGRRDPLPQLSDPTLLVRLLAALLEAPGVDASGRAVVTSARRATLAGRAHETAVSEGRRLTAAQLADGRPVRGPVAPGEAVEAAVRALRPYAPHLRLVRAAEDWVELTGLRDAVAPLVGVRPELAEAFERGLLTGALAASGAPVTVSDAGILPSGTHVWRARATVAPSARASADPALTIDTRGEPREAGVVHAMRAATRLGAGEVLEVLTEGPGSPAAFARWVDRAGHQLIAVERAADELSRPAIRLLIRKGR